jgi:hypothetical protein
LFCIRQFHFNFSFMVRGECDFRCPTLLFPGRSWWPRHPQGGRGDPNVGGAELLWPSRAQLWRLMGGCSLCKPSCEGCLRWQQQEASCIQKEQAQAGSKSTEVGSDSVRHQRQGQHQQRQPRQQQVQMQQQRHRQQQMQQRTTRWQQG